MNVEQLLERLLPRRAIPKHPPVPAGTYAYLREQDGRPTRFHLRVDDNGGGILLANAARAARLSVSGVFLAQRLLDRAEPTGIVGEIRRRFKNVRPETVERDVHRISKLLDELAASPEGYPILNLEDPALTDPAPIPDKPYCADIPLDAPGRLAPLLDRLWELAIPHVTFVAPQDADADWLIRAVERAEDLGMIAGVRARASDLSQPELLKNLAQAGIDHVNVYFLSADASVHDSLAGDGDHQRALSSFEALSENEVCAVAEVPLIRETLENIEATLQELSNRNVINVGFFAVAAAEQTDSAALQGGLASGALLQTADLIEESAQESNTRYLWYAPVRRDPGRALESQIFQGPRTSGDHAVRVDSAGDVYAARGAWQSVGNVFRDDWTAIEANPTYREYRGRVCSPTHCDDCPGLAICAADCPRSPEGWSQPSPLSQQVTG